MFTVLSLVAKIKCRKPCLESSLIISECALCVSPFEKLGRIRGVRALVVRNECVDVFSYILQQWIEIEDTVNGSFV